VNDTAAIARTAALIGLCASALACASNDIRWSEEVRLSDGRIVQLQRRVELGESAFPLQQRGRRKSIEICYAPLKLHWKSSGAYIPDIFDIVEGKAYMHVPVTGCYECRVTGYPAPNALYFVWENAAWKRISHDKFPAASQWNLLMSFVSAPGHEQEDPHGLITLEDKEARPSSLSREQKRLGWRRVNESHAASEACKKCGQLQPQSNTTFEVAPEIFVNNGRNSCGP
jgi:hypothetical protein